MNARTAQAQIAAEWNANVAAAEAGEITAAEYEIACHELNIRRNRLLATTTR